MPYTKISAKGSTVKHGASATPTTVLDGVETIGVNQGDRQMIDFTSHSSTVTMEYKDSGLRDTSEIEVAGFYDPDDTGWEAIRAAHAAGTLYYITVGWPSTGLPTWAASGYITRFNVPPAGARDALRANFTFKAITAETFTP